MSNRINLYELLPAVYRLRDAERGYALRALLGVISEQVDIVRRNIDQLWDDFFVETCEDWVVPYIGDLIGNNPLHDVALPPRADVAKTIYYRRRKGTLPMLEELARDVTDWGARTVAFFDLLCWTQNMNHIRYRKAPNIERRNPDAVNGVGSANVRNAELLDRLDGPFDSLGHSVDVRPIRQTVGWHGVRKVGFHVWRLQPFRMVRVPAAGASVEYGFTFSPLGNSAPLFTARAPETAETELANELHVPAPIRRLAFHRRVSDYYGKASEKSLAIYLKGEDGPIDVARIRSADLSTWRAPIDANDVAVDVKTGRIAFGGDEPPSEVLVDYHYGFSAEIGGGPYDRASTLATADPGWMLIQVSRESPISSLHAAIETWNDGGKPRAVIRIEDNSSYGGPLQIDLPPDGHLIIEAAGGKRPTISSVPQVLTIRAESGKATVRINGLLVQRSLQLCGDVALTLDHCTLVPGRSLDEEGNPAHDGFASVEPVDELASCVGASVAITNSIVGPVSLPVTTDKLILRDSIVDGLDGVALTGPQTTIERCTVLGIVEVKELLLASETIFTGTVTSDRLQAGCVRFCFLSEGSRTPRRYRCQPDQALEKRAEELGKESTQDLTEQQRKAVLARVVPSFTSFHYGDPAYGQLSLTCSKEIRTGAADGSEMGVFSQLKQPQREANLRIRWAEYLPFGLEPGVIYET